MNNLKILISFISLLVIGLIAYYFFTQERVYFSSEVPSAYSELGDEIKKVIELGTGDLYASRASNEFGVCGGEFDDARRYAFFDLNNDGQKDLIVKMIFNYMNCGGTGDTGHYLLVALKNDNSYSLKGLKYAGSRGNSLDTDKVLKKEDALIFRSWTYQPEGADPMCCPSKETTKSFLIKDLLDDIFYDSINVPSPYERYWAFGENFVLDLNNLEQEQDYVDVDNILNSLSWKYKQQVLHPYCFQTEWLSSDNVQEYYEKFTRIRGNYYKTKEFQDFALNIGKYWGKEINSYDPIRASWGEKIELAVSMKSCLSKSSKKYEFKDQWITSSEETDEYKYKILKEIPLDHCQNLAPNTEGQCKQSYLLSISKWGGGSMSWNTLQIFGLFNMPNGEEYILPLKKFVSEDDEELKALFNK